MAKKNLFAGIISVIMILTMTLVVAAEEPRNGAWVDDVIMTREADQSAAIVQLQVGYIDVYSSNISNPDTARIVQSDPNLSYASVFGLYSEFTFNPVGPEFQDGRLNPFSSPKIREAMNILIDRNYIAQECYGGLAIPKFTVLSSKMVDYARSIETMRALEFKYSYDFDKANAIISDEMRAMGAEKIDGLWHYKGQPIELLILIRPEVSGRRNMGDYISSQLEDIGFKVTRDYKTGVEASPIWLNSDPALGLFHVYTGAWSSPVVYRDQTHNFDQMYTPRIMLAPLFQAYTPTEDLDVTSRRLYAKDFTTLEERQALLDHMLQLGFEDSVRIFSVDESAIVPYRAEISVAADLAGGIGSSLLWAHTIKREGEVGGTIRMALDNILVNPWNPIEGSNYAQDQTAIRATMDRGIIVDPYTGLQWAHRIERGEVYVQQDLPVGKTLDWVDLHFVEEIQVPEDAWADWDAKEQRFITVAEKYPEGVTALRKSVAYYPEDFYETVKWHDGSNISLGDVVFWMIMALDRGKEDSPIYDEAATGALNTLLSHLRGIRIVSTDPLIIETYSNMWYLDAEANVSDWFPVNINFGPGAWHNITLGIMAETNKELAFSSAKADKLEVEWIGLHVGPAIPILARYLELADEQNYIPYANTLAQYITEEEASARWDNLTKWYNSKKHFWIGTGPLYLERAFPVEKVVHLKRFEDYPDASGRWDIFGEPQIPEVSLAGPRRVNRGDEAEFNVTVTFKGEPYALEHVLTVKYIVLDSKGQVALTGVGEPVKDGEYKIVLTSEQTKNLPIGANHIEAIVLPLLVSGGSYDSVTFVTMQ